jgi:hypothetical protein
MGTTSRNKLAYLEDSDCRSIQPRDNEPRVRRHSRQARGDPRERGATSAAEPPPNKPIEPTAAPLRPTTVIVIQRRVGLSTAWTGGGCGSSATRWAHGLRLGPAGHASNGSARDRRERGPWTGWAGSPRRQPRTS